MSTSEQEWYKRRVEAVEKVYGAYDVLTEHGVEIPDRAMNLQLACPFHGPDNRPSARYYGATNQEHFHCYACKVHETSIGLLAKFKNIKYNEALVQLERRFGIKVPRKPEESITESVEKSSHYESEAWKNIPRVLDLLEKKLMRLRDKASMIDFIKFCRVLDTVKWDYDHNGNVSTPPMISILDKLRKLMDASINTGGICD